MVSGNTIFAQDKKFWNNYLKGRPQAPDSFFSRIFSYHASQNGRFGTVHDAGAGNGPYSSKLRSKFAHVIVSDIVRKNVELAQDRLGTDGFSYRTAKIEDAHDIPPGSVDMVFATNVMHFADQTVAMDTIAMQLKPGGTFACSTFGPARFFDKNVQQLWDKISQQGGRELLKNSQNPKDTIGIMVRTQGNLAPLDGNLWERGAKRVNLNMGQGGITTMLPPEEAYRNTEPTHVGQDDEIVFQDEDGWGFEMDLEGIKEHMRSFPFVADYAEAFTQFITELEDLLGDRMRVRGVFPAQIILATRAH
jgi:SAM-dependent methyltransferase